MGSIPESGIPPGIGNGNPFQYSCWDNPMHRGAWWVTVHGVAKRQTQLSMQKHTWCLCILGPMSADSANRGMKLHTQSHSVELQSPCSYLFCHTATHREVGKFCFVLTSIKKIWRPSERRCSDNSSGFRKRFKLINHFNSQIIIQQSPLHL